MKLTKPKGTTARSGPWPPTQLPPQHPVPWPYNPIMQLLFLGDDPTIHLIF